MKRLLPVMNIVAVWSFAGIAVKQAPTPLVANTAWGLLALIVLMILLGFWYRRKNFVLVKV